MGIGGHRRAWHWRASALAWARASAPALALGHRRAWARAWARESARESAAVQSLASAASTRTIPLHERKKYNSIPEKSKDFRLGFALHAGDWHWLSFRPTARTTYICERARKSNHLTDTDTTTESDARRVGDDLHPCKENLRNKGKGNHQ